MKTKLTLLYAGLITLSTLIFTACQKDDSTDSAATEQEEFANASSQAEIEADIAFHDVFNNVMGINADVDLSGTGALADASTPQDAPVLYGPMEVDSIPQCITITATPLTEGSRFPLQVVIDFGEGCIGRDGRIRKGKIITVYSNRAYMPGTTISTSFEGYFVNSLKIEGTHVITNTTTANGFAFTVAIDGTVTRPNGNYIEWSSNKAIAQSEGQGTAGDYSDDAFSVTGQAAGIVKINERFFEWNTEITSPLVIKPTCRWIVKGTLSYQKNSSAVASLDYGNGACDNEATLSVNGRTRIITLY